VALQQEVVAILRGATLGAGQRPDLLLDIAEAAQNLLQRLVDAGHQQQAAELAAATVADYRDYVQAAGADVNVDRLDSNDLTPLQKQLRVLGLFEASAFNLAVDALTLLVDTLVAAAPGPDAAARGLAIGDARHNLAARLIDAGRPDDADAEAARSIAAYQHAAADAGANPVTVAEHLSSSMPTPERRKPRTLQGFRLMGGTGLEPVTSCLSSRRSPS
jgi:hypothetical protein